MFWNTCTQLVLMQQGENYQEASRLIKVARKTLSLEVLGLEIYTKRLAHVNMLEARLKRNRKVEEAVPPRSEVQKNSGSKASIDHSVVMRLKKKIQELEHDKTLLSKRLKGRPSIDPLCVNDPSFVWKTEDQEDFGIIVFGHTRIAELDAVLDSLQRQDALKYTEVWLDGHQGKTSLAEKVNQTIACVKKYPVKHLHVQNGNFGFRKMILLGMSHMCRKYREFLILEDDCFPTRDAVEIFRRELDITRNNKEIFSIYGHHFMVEGELNDTFSRFQGWGWATTSEKLLPILKQLIDCYSMSEEDYLEFVRLSFSQEIRDRIEITHPRQPSYTLERFFAWDETLGLLTALNNQVQKPTRERTIFNCGMGGASTHFADLELFRKPPFNMITLDEVWDHF